MSVSIISDLFPEIEKYFDGLPGVTTEAARIALNDTARGPALGLARMQMNSEINFPAGYLKGDRLGVSKLARNADLEAIITGRDRATSLARFASGGRIGGKNGVTVEVGKGKSRHLRRAFMIKLKSGKTMDGSTFNVGLAIRLAPGERLSNRHLPANTHASSLGSGVVLLYGPSVDQVFKSVASDIQPDVADALATEFFRQFDRLSK